MANPPFQITPEILNLQGQIQEILGELKSLKPVKSSVQLRKENKIKTVHFSLVIEGNSLTQEQVTDILENKRVLGPKNQIIEVKNALEVYDNLESLNPLKEKDLLKAHSLLMKTLIPDSGKYRSQGVGVFKGDKVSHIAPPAKKVPQLMGDLFQFINTKEISWFLKATVFHYELEFIHPFSDGNGRMGRMWQQLLLMKHSPLFEFISVESLIYKNQKSYYKVLETCDKTGDSTQFIEFSLKNILQCLKDFSKDNQVQRMTDNDRVELAKDFFKAELFSRKDYMNLHKGISQATASRDLIQAVKSKKLYKKGDKALTRYYFNKQRGL